MKKELLKGLTEEQIAKVKACKNQEEVLKVASEEGLELTDEQLEAVSGGAICTPACPVCGSTDNVFKQVSGPYEGKYLCEKCGAVAGIYVQ